MSVAFTREEDLEAAAAHVPERPVSPHPNLVTRKGLAAIEAALDAARSAFRAAQAPNPAGGVSGADRGALAIATRDLRYWNARRATATLSEPAGTDGTVVFGSRVTFERDDGRRQSFRIVGEDEADARAGSVSYVSPLARALFGKRAGDVAELAGAGIEIVSVE